MSPNVASQRRRLAVRLTAAALVWSAGLVLSALLVPVYNGETRSGVNGLTLTTLTAVQSDGAWILIPMAVPVAASILVGLALRRRHRGRPGPTVRVAWGAIALVGVLTLVLIGNVGAFFIPVVVLLAVAVRTAPPTGDAPSQSDPSLEARARA